MPFHKGHEALIEYAKSNCDHLTVLVGFRDGEPIPLKYRLHWVTSTYLHDPKITVLGDTINHPTDLSYDDLSAWWAKHILENFGMFSKVFSSEEYGAEFARIMNAENVVFNQARTIVPISATMIREKPFKYWDYLNNYAKDYFVKKIAIVGTESTGKTMMAQELAKLYNTVWCPELGRELIPNTRGCTMEDLKLVGVEHAKHILKYTRKSNKLLFVDTDLIITKGYAEFLFGREIIYPQWVEDANEMDKYIYLSADAPYVDDGTRLSEGRRNELAIIHQNNFTDAGIVVNSFHYPGNYEKRLNEVLKFIDDYLTKF